MRAPSRFMLALSVVMTLVSCATLQNALSGLAMPQVRVQQVRSLNVTPQGLVGEAVLAVDNPNRFALRLAQVDYTLDVANRAVAEGQTVKPLQVPAQGDAIAPIELRAPFESAVLAGVEFFRRGRVPYELTMTVHFSTPVGNIRVPVTHNGQLTIPSFMLGR